MIVKPFPYASRGGYPLVFVAAILCLVVAPAHAVRQYRCNGVIQYRPCTDLSTITRVKSGPWYRKTGPSYSMVLGTKFQRRDKDTGHWSGEVEGRGNIRLFLRLMKDGHLFEERYMGQVLLSGKKTTFNFLSSLPRERGWDWQIITRTR
jgi:hypothetical protein